MEAVRKWVSELKDEEICDIISSYENCLWNNHVMHEDTPFIKVTLDFLEFHNLEISNSRIREYEDRVVHEAYRHLAMLYIRDKEEKRLCVS